MTVGELIQALQEVEAEFGSSTEVRLAHQPNWPFEYSIREGLAVIADPDGQPVAYVPEGQQLGYLPGEACVALGWR